MSKIQFINSLDLDSKFYPVPAKAALPSWYKEIPSYAKDQENLLDSAKELLVNKSGEHGPATIKKCMPVFDSLSAGYFIVSHSDIIVFDQKGENNVWYRWPEAVDVITFHEFYQVAGYPFKKEEYAKPIAKWRNPWGIKTEKGYSCLVIPPMHRENIIEVMPGVVDTDLYNSPIEFPFRLKNTGWRGKIPAGTPIAQVIPFKRESYKMEVLSKEQGEPHIKKANKMINSTFYHVYKNNFWTKKDYS